MSTLPSLPFTPIDSVRVAVDAPVSTDLLADICVNLNYLYAGISNANGKSIAVFTTPGAAVWTPPPGITNIWLEMVGGGGSGYNGSNNPGGGSGAFQMYEVAGLTGAAINLFVGSGGMSGGDGTNSWFGAYNQYYAAGGMHSGGAGGGAGGVPVIGANAFGSSSPGGPGVSSSVGGIGGVPGGPFASRPAQGSSTAPGESGLNFGCGGAGGGAGGGGAGGAGGGGCIIIHY